MRLCASVCHQLLARRESAAEGEGGSIAATQIVPLDTTQTQAAGKKRLVELGLGGKNHIYIKFFEIIVCPNK